MGLITLICSYKGVLNNIKIYDEIYNKMYPLAMTNKKFSNYDDKYIIKRILRHYEVLKEFIYKNANYELADIILDIDNAIKRCELSPSEHARIMLWRDGYTELEIAELTGVTQPVVHVSIINACTKISKSLNGKDDICI